MSEHYVKLGTFTVLNQRIFVVNVPNPHLSHQVYTCTSRLHLNMEQVTVHVSTPDNSIVQPHHPIKVMC